jgi:hypothetical protein
MTVSENRTPTIRRGECGGEPMWRRRRGLAADERPATGRALVTDKRLAGDERVGRSARSEARARNAMIDAYARETASTRTPGAAPDEMRFEL